MDEATDNFDLAVIEAGGLDPASGPEEGTDQRADEAADGAADEALAASAFEGEEAAFEQLFERHRRRVARIAGRFFNRPEKVEDIVQEVFTKMYFALGDYSPRRGASFASWLSRISINACYDHLRRARRRPERPIQRGDELSGLRGRLETPGAPADAESALISRDLAEKLLSRLSPDDRLVLTLLDVEEISVAEIAEAIGWSVSKVKVRAHRARAALRRVLADLV